MSDSDERVLTIAEFAELMGVSTKAVSDWQRKGLPVYRPTKRTVRIPLGTACEWMRARNDKTISKELAACPDNISEKLVRGAMDSLRARMEA